MLQKFKYFLLFFFTSAVVWGQNDFRQNLQLAEQYFDKQEYEKALNLLDEIKRGVGHKRVYKLTYNSYLALKEYRKAERTARKRVDDRPMRHFEAYTDLFHVYEETEDQKALEKLTDEMNGIIRNNPGRAYNLSKAFQDRGYPQQALNFYLLAEKINPNLNFTYQKALLYGELGEIKKMFGTYVEMVERNPSYMSTVKTLLSRALTDDVQEENVSYLKETIIKRLQQTGMQRLQELLVHVFIQEKNFSGAFTQLKALERRNPSDKAQIFRLGKIALNNEEYELAGDIFEYIISNTEDSPYRSQSRIMELTAQRKYLENIADPTRKQWQRLSSDYQSLITELRLSGEVGEITITHAHLLAFRLGKIDTAKKELKSLINNPIVNEEQKARAKIELGDILLFDGNRWDAILYYTQAEKAFEKSPIGQEAKFKKAKAAYYVGEFDWAQGIFDVLKSSTSKLIANDAMRYSLLINDNVALDSNYEAMGLFAKADLMHYQDKLDSALTILGQLQIAFVDHPVQDEVLLLKGDIYYEKDRYQDAAKAWQNLVAEHGDDILADDALNRLAELYENELKDRDTAKDYYERIFTEHPDSFFAENARKKFREIRGDIIN